VKRQPADETSDLPSEDHYHSNWAEIMEKVAFSAQYGKCDDKCDLAQVGYVCTLFCYRDSTISVIKQINSR
jgi:hypothetical protein